MQKLAAIIEYFWFAAILAGIYFLWPGCTSDSVKSSYGREVVQSAYSQIGKRYVWGSESPGNGFDCSGLVWWAYRQHGINLPRISRRQYQVGRTVRGSLVPGDLVFFRSSLGKGRYHVGLFAGENSFIHAPQTGSRVRIDSIKASKWRRRFLGARRVL